jgi:hypothetical protein
LRSLAVALRHQQEGGRTDACRKDPGPCRP